MPAEDPHPAPLPRPRVNPEAPMASAALPVRQARDGRTWCIGTDAEVAWIANGTSMGRTITAAGPPVFEAYATAVLPYAAQQGEHDRAMLALLPDQSAGQPWWLGYPPPPPSHIPSPPPPTST